MEGLGGVGFTQYAVSNHYFSEQLSKLAMLKTLSVCQKIIFSALNFFMHIFNMSVLYLQSVEKIQDPVKALRGVDFTKYALSSIIH